MKFAHAIVLGGAGAFLAGCDLGDSERRMCETAIKQSLLNPETAEFLDFMPIHQDNYVQLAAPVELRKNERFTGDLAVSSVRREIRKIRAKEFYILRVRAERKLGNKVTSRMACAAGDTNCSCVEIEESEAS